MVAGFITKEGMNHNSLTPEEYDLWDIVRDHPGPENAIRQKVLAQILHLPDTRKVREITLSLNEKGYAVATTTYRPFGVYRMRGPGDRDAYIAQLMSRVKETAYRARLVEALEFGEIQPRLF